MQTMELRPKPRARRRWLWVVVPLVVLVAALCVGLVVQRAGRTAPGADGPVGPSGSTTRAPGLALAGAGDAVVQLQTAQSLTRVELGNGTLTTTVTPDLGDSADLLAGSGWVIGKTIGQPSGVLVRDGGAAQLLPPALQQAGELYPAGADQVWAVPDKATGGFRTAVLVDTDGDRVGGTTVRLPQAYGNPVGVLTDALVLVDDRGATYEARPAGLRQRARGTLLALGTDTTLTWVCNTQKQCDARFNNVDGTFVYLPAIRKSLTGLYAGGVAKAAGFRGIVSPDRRWVALELPAYTHTGARLVVVDLRSGHRIEVRGRLAGSKPNDQAAWTPNSRYLLALTDGRLRVLDVSTEAVSTPDGPPADLQRLTVPGSTTM